MISPMEMTEIIDNTFNIISKYESTKNLSPDETVLLENIKSKYSLNLYICCVSNYYKLKINLFGEAVGYVVFLDQICSFLQNYKPNLEFLITDSNLINIVNEIIGTTLFDKIIKTNVKSLSEIKQLILSSKINVINKLMLIENELGNFFPNIKLKTSNILKPATNLLFDDLKTQIKNMEITLFSSFENLNRPDSLGILESYTVLIKNMRMLYDLSKQIKHDMIKTKIINKICYFYTKYLEQFNFSTFNFSCAYDLGKTFIFPNTLNKMIDDLDTLFFNTPEMSSTINSIQIKLEEYDKIIFSFLHEQIKKTLEINLNEFSKGFTTKKTQVKIFEMTHVFIKKHNFTCETMALTYWKTSVNIILNEICGEFLENLPTYSGKNISEFAEWFGEIKLEFVNQLTENEIKVPELNPKIFVENISVKIDLILNYLQINFVNNPNEEKEYYNKFIVFFGSDKEYLRVNKYKQNQFNQFNKAIANGSKIINSMENKFINMSSDVVNITKNSVTNLSVKVPNVNLFGSKLTN